MFKMVRHKFEKSEDKFKEMLDNCHYSLRNDEGWTKSVAIGDDTDFIDCMGVERIRMQDD